MKKIIFLMMVIMGLGACTATNVNKSAETSVVSLQDVASESDYHLTNLYPNQGLTFGIDNNGRIFGYTGMNRFFGKVKIYNGHIEISKLATTRMGGTREAFIREEEYLTTLKSMTNIKISGNELILSNSKGDTLVFSK